MIILLYGEDEFQSSRKLAEIKKRFLEKNNPAGAGFVFDFAESGTKIDDLIMNLSSGGLFSQKKMAIVKNIFQAKSAATDENFLAYLKKMKKDEEKDITLVFWEKEKIDKKLKLAKFLLENAKRQEFIFLGGAKLSGWIKKEVEEKSEGSVTISEKAIETLTLFVPQNDPRLLEKEIEKLVSFKGKGEIEEKDVELLVRSKISSNVFKTIDSLARRDKKTAMKLLHDHLSAGDDPFYLLSMYFYQFRNLLKVKALAEKNIPEGEIVRSLKIHPYVAKKSVDQGRGFSFLKLKSLYQKLCEIDFEVKTGKVDIELALDKFVAGI